MNQPLLCVGQYAKVPYCFPKLSVNIRSVEELCYLFQTNSFLLDQDMVDQNLVTWLEKECGLTELAHKLRSLFDKANSVSLFVLSILEYVNYCTLAEQGQIAEILQSGAGLKEYEKKKKRADFLTEKRKYLVALREYDRILTSLPEGEWRTRGNIYHNCGVAYAGLFLFDRAAESFLQAFVLTGEEESGLSYLAALRQQLTEEEYIRFIADHPQYYNLSLQTEYRMKQAWGRFEGTEENRMLFTIKVYKEEGNVNSYYEEMERLTGELRQRYRANVKEE